MVVNTLGWRGRFFNTSFENSSEVGNIERYRYCLSTSINFLRSTLGPCDFEVDNVSVKEVLTWDYPIVKFDGVNDMMVVKNGGLGATSVFTKFSTLSIIRQALFGGMFDLYSIFINNNHLGCGYTDLNTTKTKEVVDGNYYNAYLENAVGYKINIDGNDEELEYDGGWRICINALLGCANISGTAYTLFFNGKIKTVSAYPNVLNDTQITNLNGYYS